MTIAFVSSCVRDVMTPCRRFVSPSTTLQQAAKNMASLSCGALPVGLQENFQGIITDSDIVIRAITQGKMPTKEIISRYVTREVYDCYENDTLENAAEIMHRHKVSRLIVRDRQGKITGILSFGAILRKDLRPEEMADIVKCAIGPVFI